MSARPARRTALFALALALGAAAVACGSRPDVITKTGADRKLTDTEIDADPLALLPAGAIGVAYLDAKKLFASPFGQRLFTVAERRMPLPPSAGFDPRRDLEAMWAGFYSMQGADVAGVAVGTFDRQKIEAAADGTQTTPLGVPLVKTEYSGRVLYTAGEVGFSVLTARTALFGNDVGIRRSIDRIEEGRVRKQLPAALAKLLAAPSAPLVAGADFTSNPVPDAARQELGFLDGVRTLAVLGNFEEPGLNLAGTLSYDTPEAATRGAQNLVAFRGTLERYAPFLALLGIPQPIRRLEAHANTNDVPFVMAVDGAAVAVLLDKAQELLTQKR